MLGLGSSLFSELEVFLRALSEDRVLCEMHVAATKASCSHFAHKRLPLLTEEAQRLSPRSQPPFIFGHSYIDAIFSVFVEEVQLLDDIILSGEDILTKYYDIQVSICWASAIGRCVNWQKSAFN